MSLEDLADDFDEDNDDCVSLSDLSDYFEQDAHLIDADIGGLHELTLDEIPYDRDLKYINVATASREKPNLASDDVRRIHKLATENVGDHEKLRKHYKKLDEKKKAHDESLVRKGRRRGARVDGAEPDELTRNVSTGKLFDPKTGETLEVKPTKKSPNSSDRKAKRRERKPNPRVSNVDDDIDPSGDIHRPIQVQQRSRRPEKPRNDRVETRYNIQTQPPFFPEQPIPHEHDPRSVRPQRGQLIPGPTDVFSSAIRNAVSSAQQQSFPRQPRNASVDRYGYVVDSSQVAPVQQVHLDRHQYQEHFGNRRHGIPPSYQSYEYEEPAIFQDFDQQYSGTRNIGQRGNRISAPRDWHQQEPALTRPTTNSGGSFRSSVRHDYSEFDNGSSDIPQIASGVQSLRASAKEFIPGSWTQP